MTLKECATYDSSTSNNEESELQTTRRCPTKYAVMLEGTQGVADERELLTTFQSAQYNPLTTASILKPLYSEPLKEDVISLSQNG